MLPAKIEEEWNQGLDHDGSLVEKPDELEV